MNGILGFLKNPWGISWKTKLRLKIQAKGRRVGSREGRKKIGSKNTPTATIPFFFSPPTPYTLLKNHVGMKIGHIPFFQGSKLRAWLNSYIYMYGAASPTPPPPPVDGSWSPPPLWLWGCGGALLVSDAADFLWFLVPPPPLWMCGWVMVVVAVLEVCI